MQAKLVESNLYTTGMLRARSAAGRVSIPVKPSVTLYAQYKHVQGVPSPDPQRGVSLTKVRTLNHLIDRLVQMRKDGAPMPDTAKLSDEALDAMIQELSQKMQTTLHNQPVALVGTTAGMGLESGALLSMTA